MHQLPPETNNKFYEAVKLHQQGDLLLSEKMYREVLTDSPEVAAIYQHLSANLLDQGKTAEAIPILTQAADLAPDDIQLNFQLIHLLGTHNDIDQALKYISKLESFYPKMIEIHINKGNLLMSRNLQHEALQAYENALNFDKKSVDALFNKATVLYQLSRLDESISTFKKVIEVNTEMLSAYISLGQILSEMGRYDDAVEYLNGANKIDPEVPSVHMQLGMALHAQSKLEEARKHYDKLMELTGPSADNHILLGNVYRDLGYEYEAVQNYNEALSIDPDNQIAQRNLSVIRGTKIPAWHFDMLADVARNKAYDKAISKAVSKDKTVLDIGTGSGLLSMMAARAGAKHVYACELVPDIADAAQQIIADNGYRDKISIHNKKSTNIRVGTELPEKADILVSEILDVGLLGEGVLPSHRHAIENLVRDGGQVIPRSADIKATIVQVDDLHLVNPVRRIEGFDLSKFDQFRITNEYVQKNLKNLNHKKLTDAFDVFNIDLHNIHRSIPTNNPVKQSIQIKAEQSGTVHGVAFWFRLHLDDEISLSSGPDGELVHWGQAINFFEHSKNVKQGEIINIVAKHSDVRIWFELED